MPRKVPSGVRPELLAPKLIAIERLISDPRNAMKHSPKNLASIRLSLLSHGQHRPLVVVPGPDGKLIVRIGNGTLEAAKQLHAEKETKEAFRALACIQIEEDALRSAARAIADNKAPEGSAWDEDELSRLLGEMDEDIATSTGFTAKELAKLLADAGTPTAPPEVAAEPAPPAGPSPTFSRMLHLYFASDSDVENAKALLGRAQERLGTTDAGQTVLRVLRDFVDAPGS